MTQTNTYIALDVGTVRIGMATADSVMRIPIPLPTVAVDGTEVEAITNIVSDRLADTVVVGYPRNQSGEATAQTEYVKSFAKQLTEQGIQVVFQDESLTSVAAEARLKNRGKLYQKADIDAEAAVIILEDYLGARS